MRRLIVSAGVVIMYHLLTPLKTIRRALRRPQRFSKIADRQKFILEVVNWHSTDGIRMVWYEKALMLIGRDVPTGIRMAANTEYKALAEAAKIVFSDDANVDDWSEWVTLVRDAAWHRLSESERQMLIAAVKAK